MCTVTVIRSGAMVRLAFNRDERRDRPAAHPPFIQRRGVHLVLTPQDPRGRGTWIAANGAGLVFALLNVHGDAGSPDPARPSRGSIIPGVADCSTLEDVLWRVDDLAADGYAPCRLLAADDRDLVEIALDGSGDMRVHRLGAPLLFTSSSLGDALAEGPRRLLFEQMLGTPWDLPAQQDAFHAHRWRDRPAVSVHMSRPDACTVSTTVVEVTAREVRMVYQPAHVRVGTPAGLVIDRLPVHADAAARPGRQYAAV